MSETESDSEEVPSLHTILSNQGFRHSPHEIRYDFDTIHPIQPCVDLALADAVRFIAGALRFSLTDFPYGVETLDGILFRAWSMLPSLEQSLNVPITPIPFSTYSVHEEYARVVGSRPFVPLIEPRLTDAALEYSSHRLPLFSVQTRRLQTRVQAFMQPGSFRSMDCSTSPLLSLEPDFVRLFVVRRLCLSTQLVDPSSFSRGIFASRAFMLPHEAHRETDVLSGESEWDISRSTLQRPLIALHHAVHRSAIGIPFRYIFPDPRLALVPGFPSQASWEQTFPGSSTTLNLWTMFEDARHSPEVDALFSSISLSMQSCCRHRTDTLAPASSVLCGTAFRLLLESVYQHHSGSRRRGTASQDPRPSHLWAIAFFRWLQDYTSPMRHLAGAPHHQGLPTGPGGVTLIPGLSRNDLRQIRYLMDVVYYGVARQPQVPWMQLFCGPTLPGLLALRSGDVLLTDVGGNGTSSNLILQPIAILLEERPRGRPVQDLESEFIVDNLLRYLHMWGSCEFTGEWLVDLADSDFALASVCFAALLGVRAYVPLVPRGRIDLSQVDRPRRRLLSEDGLLPLPVSVPEEKAEALFPVTSVIHTIDILLCLVRPEDICRVAHLGRTVTRGGYSVQLRNVMAAATLRHRDASTGNEENNAIIAYISNAWRLGIHVAARGVPTPIQMMPAGSMPSGSDPQAAQHRFPYRLGDLLTLVGHVSPLAVEIAASFYRQRGLVLNNGPDVDLLCDLRTLALRCAGHNFNEVEFNVPISSLAEPLDLALQGPCVVRRFLRCAQVGRGAGMYHLIQYTCNEIQYMIAASDLL